MKERTKVRAGTVAAAVLGADGLLHAYWATGRGAAGVRWALEGEADTTFARLNRTVYTPASLALGAIALAAARAAGSPEPPLSDPRLLESVRDGR